jgi:uncharacterized protein YjiS (DUF1127 family)
MAPTMSSSSIRRRLARGRFDEFSHLIDLIHEWWTVARQRRSLAALDDWTLKDIGITRADVENETAKPFWRR